MFSSLSLLEVGLLSPVGGTSLMGLHDSCLGKVIVKGLGVDYSFR